LGLATNNPKNRRYPDGKTTQKNSKKRRKVKGLKQMAQRPKKSTLQRLIKLALSS
jgi:hypothetical protein